MSKTLDRLKDLETIDIKPKQKTINVEQLKHHPHSVRKVFKLTEFQKGKINRELEDLKDLIEDITKKASIVIEEYEYGKIYGKV